MPKVKEVSTYDGSAWGTSVPLGANDVNIDITNSTTNPTDSSTTISSLSNTDVIVSNGDTDASAWTKYNKLRNRIASILNDMNTGTLPSYTFNITLTGGSTAWNGFTQTISDANFLTGKYWYNVAPEASDYLTYSSMGIYADDVTTNGQITFHCQDIPLVDITVHVVRTSVET